MRIHVLGNAETSNRGSGRVKVLSDVPEVYMHQFWDSIRKCDIYDMFRMDKKKKFDLNLEIFRDIFQICPRVHDASSLETLATIIIKQKSIWEDYRVLDNFFLSRAQILWGMYYKKNVDYVELLWEDFTYQIDNRARLPESMTSPEMQETKAYKTYLGYATELHLLRCTNENFKKPASPQLTTVPVSPEEPTRKSKRIKRPTKKSTNAPTAGVVIRNTPVMSLSKKKEKMTVEKRKGIELLFEVALTEEAQYEEVRKKSLRDFHKTHPRWFGVLDVTEDRINLSEAGILGRMKLTAIMIMIKGYESDQEDNEKDVEMINQTPSLLTVLCSVIQLNHLPIYIIVIPQSLPSFTPPSPQSTPTPPPTTKATNPLSALLNFTSVFQFNNRVSALENEVFELKKDDLLNTQVTALLDEHLDSRLRVTRFEFMSYLSASITARITDMVTESLEHAVLTKGSSQPQSTYEVVASLTEFKLKKILIDKMDKSLSYLTATPHRECYDGLLKYYELDKSLFSTYDKVYSLKRSRVDKDKDEDPSAGSDRGLKKKKTSKDAKLTKGLKTKESKSGSSKGNKSQLKSSGKSVQAEEPEFETPQQGPTQSWLMTLASSADKPSKTFDELMSTPIDFSTMFNQSLSKELDWTTPIGVIIIDRTNNPIVMNGNRQMVPVDYFFNNDLKYLQGGISTMTYTTSTTYTKAAQYDRQGIEDMAHKLSDDDVFDFAITLRMFTRSMVIQKRVKDLQLGVESYQKKINVTKPETTRPGIKKRDPYTPYQDPQGFIYVDNQGRNRLMRSDELYKFSDGTLTRLQTLLDDITKNIRMEYLPQRRWSSLEKKRAHIMIKAIDKQLKERRMMRSFEKFVGGRHYGTDLRLLQRTI
ncbi:hypothetical protein Tco_0264713 [Tanacetum coccineum]